MIKVEDYATGKSVVIKGDAQELNIDFCALIHAICHNREALSIFLSVMNEHLDLMEGVINNDKNNTGDKS